MKKIFVILAMAVAAVACIKEEKTNSSFSEGKTIFTGEFLNTKIALGEKENNVYKAEWEAEDQIAVYDATDETLIGIARLASESVGQRLGTFVLDQSLTEGTKVKVVFPATEISGVDAEQTKVSASDKHLVAKAESEEVTVQNGHASVSLSHQYAVVKVDVNSSEFAGMLLKSVTLYSKDAIISNDSDYARVTFTSPTVISENETQSAVFMTLPVETDTDFYVSVKLVDPQDELRTISIPKQFTAKQLKQGQVNTIPFTNLATSDNAVAWYNPECTRYIPAGGWCYGTSNTYLCSTELGVDGTFDVRAQGDFLDVIKNARKPHSLRQRVGDIVNDGTSAVWSIEGMSPAMGSHANLQSYNPTITLNVNANDKDGVAGIFDLLDQDEHIIWAYLLWAVKDDSGIAYTNGTVMKYNLGAGSVNAGNNGALYQWGRPFPFGYAASTFGTKAGYTQDKNLRIQNFKQSAENAINFGYVGSSTNTDWLQDGSHKNDLWGNPSLEDTSTGGNKSIFDPCPKGWKVSSIALLAEIQSNLTAKDDGHWIVNNDDVWPITCYRAGKDASVSTTSKTQGLYWADNASTDLRARILYLTSSSIKLYDSGRSNGIAVRCMVDTENR